jgi:hypothetical protein
MFTRARMAPRRQEQAVRLLQRPELLWELLDLALEGRDARVELRHARDELRGRRIVIRSDWAHLGTVDLSLRLERTRVRGNPATRLRPLSLTFTRSGDAFDFAGI